MSWLSELIAKIESVLPSTWFKDVKFDTVIAKQFLVQGPGTDYVQLSSDASGCFLTFSDAAPVSPTIPPSGMVIRRLPVANRPGKSVCWIRAFEADPAKPSFQVIKDPAGNVTFTLRKSDGTEVTFSADQLVALFHPPVVAQHLPPLGGDSPS